jgi:hypothetical protein
MFGSPLAPFHARVKKGREKKGNRVKIRVKIFNKTSISVNLITKNQCIVISEGNSNEVSQVAVVFRAFKVKNL